jgi:pimeloyl-ACP methyl ester carboxylesterase
MKLRPLPALALFLALLAPAQAAPDDVAPGTVLRLEFPELGEMRDRQPVAVEVNIPASYDPARPSPLLVWIAGGGGSHLVEGARGVVDFERFVVAALPFPEGRSVLQAGKKGELAGHRELMLVLLERLRDRLPNLDPRARYVAGTSNGGHLIAYAIDGAWPGFADYFTHFIIHEGGAKPLTHRLPAARDKRILFVYGEESSSLVWSTWFAWNLGQAGAAATIVGLPGSGHGFDASARAAVRDWISATLAEAPAAP